jgi:putative transposase
MDTFRRMVNDCLMIGLENDTSTMRQLSLVAYKKLDSYKIVSYYKSCAISHSAGILANRKKSLKRGLNPRKPYATQLLLILSFGFKIVDNILKVPFHSKGRGHGMIYFYIPLDKYTNEGLSDPSLKVRSFTLTAHSLSICYSKDVEEIGCNSVQGVDRNLHNVTVGDENYVVQFDLSKAVDIAENTRSIIRSFKRNDVRIRRKLYRKYGTRRKRRVDQLLHRVTKAIVQHAKQSKAAIAFEDIRNIRKLYQKGNYQGKSYRSRLNGWSFSEAKRQISYKARWEGESVIQLSIGETRGTSQLCPQCGKKITQVDRFRQLYCAECKKWMDRDVVAAMNIASKGLQRFCSSQGLADEAMKRNLERHPIILRVNASKLGLWRELKK